VVVVVVAVVTLIVVLRGLLHKVQELVEFFMEKVAAVQLAHPVIRETQAVVVV
jgi:hypothetical protein